MEELDLFAGSQPNNLDLFSTQSPVETPAKPPVQSWDLRNQQQQPPSKDWNVFTPDYDNGTMPPNKREVFEEAKRRGLLKGWGTAPPLSSSEQSSLSLARDTGPIEASMVGLGKGFANIMRGVIGDDPAVISRFEQAFPNFKGIVSPEESPVEKEAMEALATESPLAYQGGEMVGEAAPFVPAAMATGGIPALLPRALATGVVGAVEGGLIEKGRGGDGITGAGIGGTVGFAAELLLPVVGKFGGQIVRRVTGEAPKGALIDAAGKPTTELVSALNKTGVTFEDLTSEATEFLGKQAPGTTPEEAIRKAFLQEQGIEPTTAQITREAADFQAQQEATKTSGRVRTAIENQEAVLTSRFNDAITATTGKSSSATSTTMDAVVDKATTLDKEISALYKSAREVAPDTKNIKFNNLTRALKRALPSNRKSGGNIEALLGEMQSIGILDKDMNLVGKVGVETAEELRKFANTLYDPQNGFGNDLLRKVKDVLDDDVFTAAGDDLFKQARKAKADFENELTRAKITKFDSRKQNLVKDILENKIDPDQFIDKVVLGKTWRAKDLAQLKDYITDAGDGPLNDLKAEVIETIKNRSFIGPEDANGFKALSRDKLENTLEKIGRKKLEVIFGKDELKFLDDMLKVAKLREPVRGTALGKGPSGQAVAALEKKLRDFPVVGAIVGLVDYDAAGRAVIKAKPKVIKPKQISGEIAAPAIVAGTSVALANQRGENE